MADVPVTCITKPHPFSAHEHITHIGNPAGGWRWNRERVIESIEAKTNTFYVLGPGTGKKAYIGVIKPPQGQPYLRTYTDGVWTDNLLSLPQCT
jgi:hypothetical protein